MASFMADRRLYLTEDRERVVEHGDPDARFLLCAEGQALHPDHVERFGLRQEDGKVVIPGQKQAEKPEDKMAAAPEDKSAGSERVENIDATSAAEELAEEHDLDLAEIEGTGKDGRILKSDVQAALE